MNINSLAALGAGSAVAVAAIAAAVLIPKSKPRILPEQPPAAVSVVPRAPPPPIPTTATPQPSRLQELAEKLRASLTLSDALAVARPQMVDKFGESSLGTTMLAVWGVEMLSWSEVAVVKDETSYALAKKDIDLERGKRLCLAGPIIEIGKDGSGRLSYFSGLMESARGDLFHFHAVKSTGDIVQGSYPRFCGVITGEFSYNNSGGGTGHALDIVGMFDLPENKR